MKKLSLNKINFAGAMELTREQMKKVMGGNSNPAPEGSNDSLGDDCVSSCSSDSQCGDGLICKGVDMSGVCDSGGTRYHCLLP